MKRIAIFASGNGSNAENIISYFREHPCGVEAALVVCNRPDAAVIGRAKRLGVPVEVMTRSEINEPSVILGLLKDHAIDAIALAGFLLMIPAFLIERYHDRIVNIHPSLLPKFGGKGMYGRHVHEAVVAAGECESGITIHLVSEQCDEGQVLFQAAIPVSPADTAADVERKIHELERRHYPEVLAGLLTD